MTSFTCAYKLPVEDYFIKDSNERIGLSISSPSTQHYNLLLNTALFPHREYLRYRRPSNHLIVPSLSVWEVVQVEALPARDSALPRRVVPPAQ